MNTQSEDDSTARTRIMTRVLISAGLITFVIAAALEVGATSA
jgi:hypothetical protein